MNGLLESLNDGQLTAGFMLVLGRIGPLFLIAPLFSSKMLPARARLVAALALSVGLAPLALERSEVPLDVFGLGGLMIKEIMVGLAFAFAVGVVMTAVSIAGNLLDTLVGYAFGALVDPLTGNNNAVLAQAYGLVGVMIFIAIGGDTLVIQGLARTYDLVPLAAFPSINVMTEGVLQAFVGIFASALELAAPVILALVITDVAFGLMSRVVPQMNVFSVGFPAKIIVGLFVIAASLPFASTWIGDNVRESIGGALQAVEVVR